MWGWGRLRRGSPSPRRAENELGGWSLKSTTKLLRSCFNVPASPAREPWLTLSSNLARFVVRTGRGLTRWQYQLSTVSCPRGYPRQQQDRVRTKFHWDPGLQGLSNEIGPVRGMADAGELLAVCQRELGIFRTLEKTWELERNNPTRWQDPI